MSLGEGRTVPGAPGRTVPHAHQPAQRTCGGGHVTPASASEETGKGWRAGHGEQRLPRRGINICWAPCTAQAAPNFPASSLISPDHGTLWLQEDPTPPGSFCGCYSESLGHVHTPWGPAARVAWQPLPQGFCSPQLSAGPTGAARPSTPHVEEVPGPSPQQAPELGWTEQTTGAATDTSPHQQRLRQEVVLSEASERPALTSCVFSEPLSCESVSPA